jgi:ABC-type polysaccharide/polyol phosphate export permease
MVQYRYLFSQLVRRELRQKYMGSALGVLWYLANPLVLMGAYTLMFGLVLKLPHHADYPLFLMIGLVAWTFFQQALLAAAPSLIDQGGLIRKANFPRQTIPAAIVTVQLITFCAVLVLLIPLTVAIRARLSPALLLMPVLIALLFCFALGCALIVSALHAYFRDVVPVLTAAMLPWFFLTPIYYEPSTIPFFRDHAVVRFCLEWVNPVAPFVEAMRWAVYGGRSGDWVWFPYALVAAGVALGLGTAVFRRAQGELAVVL